MPSELRTPRLLLRSLQASDRDEFVRVHRSTVVNLRRVQDLRPYVGGDYIVRLKSGAEVRLGWISASIPMDVPISWS